MTEPGLASPAPLDSRVRNRRGRRWRRAQRLACLVAAATAAAAATGACGRAPQVVWRLDAQAAEPTAPLFAADLVAFGHAHGISLVERGGSLRCQFADAGRVTATPRTNGELYFFGGSNQIFYAIDRDCRPVWTFITGAAIDQAPEVLGNLVHVGSHDGHLYALEAASGRLAWSFPDLPTLRQPAPEVPMAIAALDLAPRAPASRPKGHRARRAALRHRRAAGLQVMAAMPQPAAEDDAVALQPGGGFGARTPVAVGGVVYAVNDDHFLYGLEATSGALVGRFDLGARAAAPPIMMNGLVVVATTAGEVRAIDRQRLSAVWSTPLKVQPGSVPHLVRKSIAFFSLDAGLVGLDPLTGRQCWSSPTPQRAGGSAEFFGPWTLTYVPGAHAGIVAADNRSGKVVWQLPTRGDLPSHVAREGRRLWVLAGDGRITCLQLPDLGASA